MLKTDPTLDHVTGVLNRHAGLQAAHRVLSKTNGEHFQSAILWLGLDRFRQVNLTFGHAAGDRVITLVARRIRATMPESCEISRMGNDEFICLLPEVDTEEAVRLAQTLLSVIEAPLSIGDIQFRPSISIGVALHFDKEDVLVFFERCERAMAEAKRQGGNRLVVSGTEPVPGRVGILLAREELVIENDLHTALETGGLILNYQPIICCADGRIEAIEALMRCKANGKPISPGKFIPVAEKTGLIVRLGEWSLLQGARYAALLQREEIPTKVAINVSRLQLISPKFIQAVHAALICANVDPKLIELELTESLMMDVSEIVQSNLRSIRSIGMGLAIDDFGTGYSCLATIKDIPATKLKIDRAFVCVLPEDKRALVVVKAITQLGKELGMTVVAEGVETQEQLDALKQAGVDAIQGFLQAVPMTEDVLKTWLHHRKTPKIL